MSTDLTEAVREIVQMVRPELNEAELDAAAAVIAADVQPDATSVTPDDVRRTRDAVAEAVAHADAGTAGA